MKRRGSLLNLLLLTLVCVTFLGSAATAQTGGDDSLIVGGSKWSPTVTWPNDSLVLWCEGASICFDISAWDNEDTDSLALSLLSGPITYDPQVFGREFATTICFQPEGAGEYEFIWQVVDLQDHEVVDTVLFTVEAGGEPPTIDDQQFFAEVCDLAGAEENNIEVLVLP